MSDNQKNKELVQKLYEEALNKGNMGIVKDIISEDYVGPQGEKGPASFEKIAADLIQGFPDIHYQILDLLGEDGKVAVRWKWQGTNTGRFRNIPPTGKVVVNEGQSIFECKGGKIIGTQTQTDRLGFLQELGVLPVDQAQLAQLGRLAQSKSHQNGSVYFIDKFLVPAPGKDEFYERMNANRRFLRTLPGFIGDDAYEYTDNNGNLVTITIAHWENQEAINKAREAVQEEYKKEGFDMQAMLKRLNITMDRGLYKESAGH